MRTRKRLYRQELTRLDRVLYCPTSGVLHGEMISTEESGIE